MPPPGQARRWAKNLCGTQRKKTLVVQEHKEDNCERYALARGGGTETRESLYGNPSTSSRPAQILVPARPHGSKEGTTKSSKARKARHETHLLLSVSIVAHSFRLVPFVSFQSFVVLPFLLRQRPRPLRLSLRANTLYSGQVALLLRIRDLFQDLLQLLQVVFRQPQVLRVRPFEFGRAEAVNDADRELRGVLVGGLGEDSFDELPNAPDTPLADHPD